MTIALAIILHLTKGMVLIARRRSDAHLPDLWEFPGGKCGEDEKPAACAVREAYEETGLTVTVLEAWPIVSHNYPERTVQLHPFLCLAESGDPQPLGSCEIQWVRPEELSQYTFPKANQPLLERLRMGFIH